MLSQEEFGKDEEEYVIKLGSFIVYEFTNEMNHILQQKDYCCLITTYIGLLNISSASFQYPSN